MNVFACFCYVTTPTWPLFFHLCVDGDPNVDTLAELHTDWHLVSVLSCRSFILVIEEWVQCFFIVFTRRQTVESSLAVWIFTISEHIPRFPSHKLVEQHRQLWSNTVTNITQSLELKTENVRQGFGNFTGKHLDLPALVGGHLRICWKRGKNGSFLHHC